MNPQCLVELKRQIRAMGACATQQPTRSQDSLQHLRPAKLGIVALCAASLFSSAQADPFDWLYFPMYQRDTAHAVHLSALKPRPDGLLDSATRYPRVREEQWTQAESDAGWNDYQQRLIDCETGFSIVYREHLLSQEGKIIASRDNTAANLAKWKADLSNEMRQPAWPIANEIFLACAAAGDAQFLAQRRQASKKKVEVLSYTPRIKALKAETHDVFWRKTQFRPDIEGLLKHPPADAYALFGKLQNQHRAWLSGFAPDLVRQGKSGSEAAAAGLNEENQRWLSSQQIEVANVSSRPDGTVRYTNLRPAYADLPDDYREVPSKLRNAEAADLDVYLDCRSGRQVPSRLLWLDGERKPLASVPISVKPLLQALKQQAAYNDGAAPENILQAASNNAICQAVAAQCMGKPPAELYSFAFSVQDEEAIKLADSPAAALLAVRKAYRNYRRNFIPDCAIGKSF